MAAGTGTGDGRNHVRAVVGKGESQVLVSLMKHITKEGWPSASTERKGTTATVNVTPKPGERLLF